MPDHTLVFPPGFRLLDADGNVVAGGSVEFYNAGTSNARTVYSDSGLSTSLGTIVYLDSGGYPVSTQGGSNKVSVYTGTSAYKVIIKTSAAVTLATIDNISGALDTSSFTVTSAAPDRPIVSRSDTSWTVSSAAGDGGTIYKSNPTSGAQTVTLPSAITAGNGYTFTLIHDGGTSTNTVRWQTVSNQTVDINGSARAAGALLRDGEAITFVSDGANWTVTEYKAGLLSSRVPVFTVADRLTAPPTSPTPGARYIINGTPTGDWSSFAQHDVVEATGSGTWVRITPTADCGWFVYVEDENLYTAFVGSAWSDQTGMPTAQSSTLRQIAVSHTDSQGQVGGTATGGAYTKRTLNTTDVNTITTANGASGNASLASNEITLPTGTYDVDWFQCFRGTASYTGRFISTTDSAKVIHGTNDNPGASVQVVSRGRGRITVSATSETFKLDYYVSTSQSTTDLGGALNLSGRGEIYARVIITDLASLQGATGSQGPQGSVAATPAGTLTLANGSNNDVANSGQYLRISGPTGSFTITGLVAPTSNSVLFLKNTTSQNMTLANESASSTAANRIITQTGADVTLTGVSAATLIYDTVEARWQLMSTQG